MSAIETFPMKVVRLVSAQFRPTASTTVNGSFQAPSELTGTSGLEAVAAASDEAFCSTSDGAVPA